METIRVNMNPNPLDVQTIHASQNDGEARQWEFELHNNGELIDTSDVTEQMFFKSYKGGTEQLLPENTSTPTTSPFKGDIRYPQGLLTDQEFTYRQSPTQSDGNAKIQTIYGNTLKWNQLATFTPRSGTEDGLTFEFKADGTMVFNGTATDNYFNNFGNTYNIQGHKLYIKGCPSGGSNSTYYLRDGYNGVASERDFGNGVVVTARANTILQIQILQGVTVTNLTFTPQLFDLTAMGLDSLTDDEVKQWFSSNYPLPYYQYDSGSLLPFRGEGLKTVGKNLFDGIYNNLAFANTVAQSADYRGYTLNVSGLKGKQITVSRADTTSNNRFRASFFSAEPQNLTPFERELNNGDQYYSYDSQLSFTLTVPNGANYLLLYISNNGTVAKDLMIEIGSAVSDYEPYASSTLSLPISTYFPNGMKSAGNVYDELTESKAITRIGSRAYQSGDESDTSVITDGTTTYYALATPTEASFTTASLVTENAEIPLSNNDGTLIGKCTEQLSENPGFIDAKIKLTDSDGECYSNKIQLHVERSPQ